MTTIQNLKEDQQKNALTVDALTVDDLRQRYNQKKSEDAKGEAVIMKMKSGHTGY